MLLRQSFKKLFKEKNPLKVAPKIFSGIFKPDRPSTSFHNLNPCPVSELFDGEYTIIKENHHLNHSIFSVAIGHQHVNRLLKSHIHDEAEPLGHPRVDYESAYTPGFSTLFAYADVIDVIMQVTGTPLVDITLIEVHTFFDHLDNNEFHVFPPSDKPIEVKIKALESLEDAYGYQVIIDVCNKIPGVGNIGRTQFVFRIHNRNKKFSRKVPENFNTKHPSKFRHRLPQKYIDEEFMFPDCTLFHNGFVHRESDANRIGIRDLLDSDKMESIISDPRYPLIENSSRCKHGHMQGPPFMIHPIIPMSASVNVIMNHLKIHIRDVKSIHASMCGTVHLGNKIITKYWRTNRKTIYYHGITNRSSEAVADGLIILK